MSFKTLLEGELLNSLLTQGPLEFGGLLKFLGPYHDPCFWGRQNLRPTPPGGGFRVPNQRPEEK